MKLYPAYIHKSPNGTYGASFADVAIMAGGDTYEQAIANAIDGLAAHIDALIVEGISVPEPSTADDAWAAAKADPDLAEGLAGVQMIPVEVSDKTQRVLITLPGSLLKRLDSATANRSRFIAEAVREMLVTRVESAQQGIVGHRTEDNIKNLSSARTYHGNSAAVRIPQAPVNVTATRHKRRAAKK